MAKANFNLSTKRTPWAGNPKLFKAFFGATPQQYMKDATDVLVLNQPVEWHSRCNGWVGSRSWIFEPPCPDCGIPPQLEAHEICQRLLEFDGTHVLLEPEDIGLAGPFARYGEFVTNARIEHGDGTPNMCHDNVCELVESGKIPGQMMTGFAIALDNTWCRHSWWRFEDGTILETTPAAFHSYFGVALTTKDAEVYCSLEFGYPVPSRTKAKSRKPKRKAA